MSEDEFVSMILSADPLYNGQRTYTLTGIGGESGTKIPADLGDEYYQYAGTYTATQSGNNYVVTITG